MADQKKYYWLRLHDDFFSSVRIKKLRKMAGGDTFVIIYLKMQLMAMKKGGVLTFSGLEEDFASELALDLDEDKDNVKLTLAYLLRVGLAETSDNVSYFFPYAVENTGSETASTQRSRECRERKKLQRTTSATLLQQNCNATATLLQRRDIDIDIDIDRDRDRVVAADAATTTEKTRFVAPTVSEVSEYCRERGNGISPQAFVDYYTANGWKLGRVPMRDWRAAIRTWEKKEQSKPRYGNFDAEEAFKAALERSYGELNDET